MTPKGELVIHPAYWRLLFLDPRYGALCPACCRPVFAMTPIHLDYLDDGRISFIHAEGSRRARSDLNPDPQPLQPTIPFLPHPGPDQFCFVTAVPTLGQFTSQRPGASQ